MVKSQFSRPLYRLVLAAVVDDQILNGIDAVNVTGQVIVRQFQCFLLIVTWYLNDQFHILLPFLHIQSRLCRFEFHILQRDSQLPFIVLHHTAALPEFRLEGDNVRAVVQDFLGHRQRILTVVLLVV